MKISAKGRYGLAALAYLAKRYEQGAPVTIISIAEDMGISKIYLEQVFSLLKRADLVKSVKGAQGGYRLAKEPRNITACDVLSTIELSLMEEAGKATESMPEYDRAINAVVYAPLDEAVKKSLSAVSLEDIATAVDREGESLMYFI